MKKKIVRKKMYKDAISFRALIALPSNRNDMQELASSGKRGHRIHIGGA